ncbi:hypothetical protein Tco_0703040 [Tanacetum coccineum]|uniref:Uncharacterized protein n=1 Tax=Tanacetum coccineum TaxID=301880 RepID=A0ABQ4XXW7_9ASTR
MGEPFSPDCVFDFPMDELEPYPAYDFFTPGPLPGYAGNPNNNNGWIEADVPLLGELGVEADELMVGPLVGKIVEPIVDMEDDDDSEGFEDGEEVWEEVGGPSTAATEGQSFPFPTPGLHVPPTVIEDLITHKGNLEYGHGQLIKKVIQVSDVEVADGITIREIGPRVFAIEGKVQVMTSQMVQAEDGLEQVQALQAAVQQRNSQIQQLQTMVSEMSSRERKLMQCIQGMDRRLADL